MLTLASYKLRFHDLHARIVPARDEAGCAFAGPAVELFGAYATPLLALASPFRAWLEAREPGVVLRTLSVDLRSRRILMTLAPMTADQRPRLVRVDAPESDDVIEEAKALEEAAGGACVGRLRGRREERGEREDR